MAAADVANAVASLPSATKPVRALASDGASAPITTYTLENYSAGLDAASDSAAPGTVTLFDPSTPLPDSLGVLDQAPVCVVISKLRFADACRPLNKDRIEELRQRSAAIAASVSSGPRTSGGRLPAVDATLKGDGARDAAPWDSTLATGSKTGAAFVGLYVAKNSFGVPEEVYIAAASAAPPEAVDKVRAHISKDLKGMTYGRLHQHPAYHYLLRLTQRNAHRLATEHLIELSLLRTVAFANDYRAVTESESEVASPLIHEPLTQCLYNVLAPLSNGKIGYYCDVIPLEYSSGEFIPRILHPVQGVALFNVDPTLLNSCKQHPSQGSPVNPRRPADGESTEYDRDIVARAYVSRGSRSVVAYVEAQSFAAIDTKSITLPAFASRWTLLEPLHVIVT